MNSNTNSGASFTVGSPGMSASTTPVEHQGNRRRNLQPRRDHRNCGNHDQQQHQDLNLWNQRCQKALLITPPSTRSAAPVVAEASGLAT